MVRSSSSLRRVAAHQAPTPPTAGPCWAAGPGGTPRRRGRSGGERTAELQVTRRDRQDGGVKIGCDDRIRAGGEVVLGGNDAACAHLALGVESASSRAVLAAGTSAALRTTTDAFHDHPELFCLTMGPGCGYLLGSAFSNMGNALGWLSDQLGIPFSALIPRGLSTARRGRLPLALPYWYGERSPWWRDGVTGGWLSVQASHTVDDLLGAVWLSWAAGFSRALSRLNETAGPVTEICSGSALLNTPGLAQWLADALGISVLVEPWDASLMGALSLALGSAPRQTEPARICRPKDPVLKERTEAARKALDQIMPGLLAGWPGGPKPGPKPRPQS